MAMFVPLFGNDRLFTSPLPFGNLFLVLPPGSATAGRSELAEAWSSADLCGTFAYAAAGLPVTAESANEFIAAVLGRVSRAGVRRGFLWAAPASRQARCWA